MNYSSCQIFNNLLSLRAVIKNLAKIFYKILIFNFNQMEEKTNQEPVQPEKESFLDKAKKLFRKADDFVDDKVDDVKKSEAFKKAKVAYDKAEDFVEDKIEDIKESGVKEKLEAFADRVEDKTENAVGKMKEFSKKVADKTADKLEDIAENIKKKTAEEDKPADTTKGA